ncbi:MAG: carbohydrate kinase [Ginsengibacter sp.]
MKTSSSPYKVVCFGEVLWDILPSGPLPGGAPMNVAYHLQKLNTNIALITKIGNDQYGKDLVNMLAESGVAVKYETDLKIPTGLVYAKEGPNHEMTYDIVFPSAWDFIEWQPEYEAIVSSADYFVFGSLTSRNEVSRDTLRRLTGAAKKNVMDINIRPPHFERDQADFLLHRTDLLKMNLAELELVSGWFNQKGNATDRIKFVQDHFKIDQIIVTKGGDGAMVNDHGVIHEHPGYKVTVQDTIGSGDSFLAGFLSQLLKGESAETALDFASGIGAFVATKAGGCPKYEVEEIDELMAKRK